MSNRNTFFFINIFFFTHNTTQHPKYNKTKQQTHTQHLKVQSKGRERGKDNKKHKSLSSIQSRTVYQTKNTAKHEWSKAWPHQLAPLYIHKSLFAGGYGSNMFFHTCKPVLYYSLLRSCKTSKQHSLLRRLYRDHKLGLANQSIRSKDDKTRFACVHRLMTIGHSQNI